jgi:opacity protein-like surface antigen
MSIQWGQRLWFMLATVGACGAGLILPASARNGAWYVGGDFGGMILEDQSFIIPEGRVERSFFLLNQNYGFDGSAFIGYDLGAFRIEAETAYKRAEVRATAPVGGGPVFGASGSTSALSFMVNGLLDFGDDDGVSGFVGGGVGVARIDYNNVRAFSNQAAFLDDSDTRFAWQIIAGVRQAVTPNVDIGLKYRMFNVPNINVETVGRNPASTSLTTHSALFSVSYNFLQNSKPTTAVVTPILPQVTFGRPYIEVGGGMLFVPHVTYDGLFGTTPSMSFNAGFDGSIFVGYDLGAFRLEAETSYKRAGTDQLTVSGIPFSADGSVSVFSVMGNGLININNVAPFTLPLSPFIGGGIGVSNVTTSFATLNRTDIDSSDARFAWQIMAGVRQAITDNIDVTLRYRFFHVDNVRTVDFRGLENQSRFRSHSLLGGISYNFGAPPPPPPPPN